MYTICNNIYCKITYSSNNITICIVRLCDMKAEFAENLKKLREANGLSQTELAIRINVNKSLISAYENELRLPSLLVLSKLAYLFNVSMEFLLGIRKSNTIDVSKLTNEQVSVITSVVKAFEDANKYSRTI